MARPKGKVSAALAAKAAEQSANTSTAAIPADANGVEPNSAEGVAGELQLPPEQEGPAASEQLSTDSEKPKPVAKARSKSPAVENIVSGTGVTIENCTHFQNEQGRVFAATEVLRRMARRQNLQPVMAPRK